MFSFNYSINVSSIYTLIFSWHRARGRLFARAVFLFDVYYCLHSHKVLRISISHPSNGECHIHHACLVFYVPIRSLGPDAPPTFCHNLFYTLRQIVHLFIVPRYTHTYVYTSYIIHTRSIHRTFHPPHNHRVHMAQARRGACVHTIAAATAVAVQHVWIFGFGPKEKCRT